MGFRFRKSKTLGPLRITASGSGVSYSVGGKGLRFTLRADGKQQISAGIPGTGLYYTQLLGGKSKKRRQNQSGNAWSR